MNKCFKVVFSKITSITEFAVSAYWDLNFFFFFSPASEELTSQPWGSGLELSREEEIALRDKCNANWADGRPDNLKMTVL